MTNQQADPLLVAPPRFYWYLHLNRAGQGRALKKGNEIAAKEFILQVKAGVDMLVRREPDREKRLYAYRLKPAALWAEQMAKFPSGYWWAFEESWDDWISLAPGDPVREQKAREIMAIEAMREAPVQMMQPQVADPAMVAA